jgi:beta-galactosidase
VLFRSIDRVEDVTKVTVYSNQPEVELFANGESLGKITAEDHFFYFDVPNVGETELVAVAGEWEDESFIRKVDTFNEAYRLREKGAILNWFDITEVDGYFSLNDKISDVMSVPEGQALFAGLMQQMMPKNEDGKMEAAGFELGPEMMQMMGGFTIVRLSGMMGMMNIEVTKEQLLGLNAMLNQIKKPE